MDAATGPASFATIVAIYLRDITNELERAPVVSAAVAQEMAPPDRSSGASPPPLLSAACAERLASGSLVFPAALGGDGWLGEPAWHVFSHRRDALPEGGVSSGEVLFAQAGVIGGALGDDAFVALAYHLILQRPPDPEGHAAYRQTLQSGHQTRHGVLRDLAGSAEAGTSGRLLVILSRDWLPADGLPADGLLADGAVSDAGEGLPDAVRVELHELFPHGVDTLAEGAREAPVDGGMA